MTYRTNPRFARSRLTACLALAALAFVAGVSAQQSTAPARTRQHTVEATATVTAIDKVARSFTLRDENGRETTIVAGPEIQRFDEFEVGDQVKASYALGVTAELRAPTEAEAAEPLVVAESEGRAPDDAATPAAGAGRMMRIVATIEAIDRAAQTVTLKGPNGNMMTVQVADAELLAKPKVGDKVVVTASESVAISLEKVAKK